MLIEPTLIDKVWPHVWPLIEELVILETQEELLASLRSGDRFLLIVSDGVCVCGPHGKLFEVNYVAGKKAKEWWPKMSQMIDGLSKACGTKFAIAFGGDAWKKLAPDYTATKTRMYIKEVA